MWIVNRSSHSTSSSSSSSHSHSYRGEGGEEGAEQHGIALLHVLSLLLLVLGSEVYGRDAEPPMDHIANFASGPTGGPGSNQFNYNVEIIPQSNDFNNSFSSSGSGGMNNSNSNNNSISNSGGSSSKVKAGVRL